MASSIENLSLEPKEANNDDDVVNPWNVCSKNKTGIDYDKLIRKQLLFITFYSVTIMIVVFLGFYSMVLYTQCLYRCTLKIRTLFCC